MTTKIIDSTEFYNIIDESFICCDEQQFIYYCKAHQERMECQFCSFDPYVKCECSE